MPVYLCRWPDGECSVVQAPNKDVAIEALDEEGNTEGLPITQIRDFMALFTLTNKGDFRLVRFGSLIEDVILRTAYPVLEKALDSSPDTETPESKRLILEAVKTERKRVRRKKVKEPKTELGRRIRAHSDTAPRLADRMVSQMADETLKGFKPRGKPQ